MVSYHTNCHRFTNGRPSSCASSSPIYRNPNSLKWISNMPQFNFTPYSVNMCSMSPTDQCFRHTISECHYPHEKHRSNETPQHICLSQSLSAHHIQNCATAPSLAQQNDCYISTRSDVDMSEVDGCVSPSHTTRLSTCSSPIPEDHGIFLSHAVPEVDWTDRPGHLECMVFGRQCDVDPLLTDITSQPEPLVFSRSELATYMSLTNCQLQFCASPAHSSCPSSPINCSTIKLCSPPSTPCCSSASSRSSNSPPSAPPPFPYSPNAPNYRFAPRESCFFRTSCASQENASPTVASHQRALNRRRTQPVSPSFSGKRKSPVTAPPTTLRYDSPHRFMKRPRVFGIQASPSSRATHLGNLDATATDEGFSDTPSFPSSSKSSGVEPHSHYSTSYSPTSSSTDSFSSPYVFPTSPTSENELDVSEPEPAPRYHPVAARVNHSGSTPLHGYKRLQLLNFIIQLLEEPSIGNPAEPGRVGGGCLHWVDRSARIFSIRSPDGLARLWGQYRNNQNMTFESLCRSLRLYYRSGKLERVRNQRYQYRLLSDHGVARHGSAGPAPPTSATLHPNSWGNGRLQVT